MTGELLDRPVGEWDGTAEIGKHGRLRIRAVKQDGRTELIPTFRRIPYQWHGVHHQDHDDQPYLLVQNSGGGFVEGDTGLLHYSSCPGTRALLTTTEATKFYRSDTGAEAFEEYRFEVGENSLLEFFPDEVIPYAGSRTVRRTQFDLTSTSRMIAAEVVVAGRVHFRRDELFGFSSFKSKLQIDVDGTPRYIDHLVAAGHDVKRLADMWAGHCIMATIVAYADALTPAMPGKIERVLGSDDQIRAGASIRNSVLVVRILGSDLWRIHDATLDVWRLLRPLIAGKPARRIVK